MGLEWMCVRVAFLQRPEKEGAMEMAKKVSVCGTLMIYVQNNESIGYAVGVSFAAESKKTVERRRRRSKKENKDAQIGAWKTKHRKNKVARTSQTVHVHNQKVKAHYINGEVTRKAIKSCSYCQAYVRAVLPRSNGHPTQNGRRMSWLRELWARY